MKTQGNTVVALFAIDRPGLYVVAVAGATPSTTGNYAVNLTVAGDLNGDGNVDGNDSALLRRGPGQRRRAAPVTAWPPTSTATARSTSRTQVILAGDYGFHATTAAVPTRAPARPVFDLDVNSDTAPVGDGMTTDSHGDPGRPDRPEPDRDAPADRRRRRSRTPTACSSSSTCRWPPAATPSRSIATNAAGVSSQFTKIITRTQPGLSLTPPVISARLANDTGRSALDNITSDDTVTGSITAANPIASFQAQIDQSPVDRRARRAQRHDVHDHAGAAGDDQRRPARRRQAHADPDRQGHERQPVAAGRR